MNQLEAKAWLEGRGAVISLREGTLPLDSRTGGRVVSSLGDSLTISLSREGDFSLVSSSLSSLGSSLSTPESGTSLLSPDSLVSCWRRCLTLGL